MLISNVRDRLSSSTWWPAVALGAAALAVRVPAFMSSKHLTFDDGVFGASAVAMRHGGVPFRDVFSSQGPLFLPLVWLFDLVGFRTQNAPRLLAVAAGIAVTVTVFVIVRRFAGPTAALVGALLASTSGSLLWATGPLAADGPGLALAVLAVAAMLSYRDAPTTAKAVVAGGLIGAAFAVKSLFAVPPGIAIAWVFLERRAWSDLARAVAVSAFVVVAASVPWGLADVWDQSVDYHLDAAGERTPGANARKLTSTLWDRDLLLLVASVTGGAMAFLHSRRRGAVAGRSLREHRWGGPLAPVAAWLVALLLVLLLEHPLWRPHLAHLVVPLAILSSVWGSRNQAVFGRVLLVAAVAHAFSITGVLWPGGYEGTDARAATALESLPDDAWAVSDEPGFLWRAGLRTPDDLVDGSILRIESGRLTPTTVTDAALMPRVCAVLVWSERFGDMDLGDRLPGYHVSEDFGGPRRLLVRDRC